MEDNKKLVEMFKFELVVEDDIKRKRFRRVIKNKIDRFMNRKWYEIEKIVELDKNVIVICLNEELDIFLVEFEIKKEKKEIKKDKKEDKKIDKEEKKGKSNKKEKKEIKKEDEE